MCPWADSALAFPPFLADLTLESCVGTLVSPLGTQTHHSLWVNPLPWGTGQFLMVATATQLVICPVVSCEHICGWDP